jgi:hypothetical protein
MQSGGNREVIERLQRGHREDEKRHSGGCLLLLTTLVRYVPYCKVQVTQGHLFYADF